MPDSVANKGIDSGVKWLNQNKGQDYKGYKFIATDRNIQLVPNGKTIVTYGKGACVLAIGNAIGCVLRYETSAVEHGVLPSYARLTGSVGFAWHLSLNLLRS